MTGPARVPLRAVAWDRTNPRRCPECGTGAVDERTPRQWTVYTCWQCGTRFCRWPALETYLVDAGVACAAHRKEWIP